VPRGAAGGIEMTPQQKPPIPGRGCGPLLLAGAFGYRSDRRNPRDTMRRQRHTKAHSKPYRLLLRPSLAALPVAASAWD